VLVQLVTPLGPLPQNGLRLMPLLLPPCQPGTLPSAPCQLWITTYAASSGTAELDV